MSAPQKYLSSFDKILIAGILLGIMGICALTFVFYFLWVNPSGDRSESTSFDRLAPTPTVELSASDLAATLSAGNVTATATPAVAVPSPTSSFFDAKPPLSGRIVFTCFVDQIDQICVMDADGTHRRQVTESHATSFYASFSLGEEMIYYSSRETGHFQIYAVRPNGKDFKRLTQKPGEYYAPELSPNGEWIVMSQEGEGLWVMKPDGTNLHSISDRDDIDPAWSPDGSMIAFASSRAGARQLFVMNTDGTNIRQVTNLDNMGGRISWSPDGARLAFYAGPAANHNIFTIDLNGMNLTQLTHGGDNLAPSWSPDGYWIAFTSFRDGNNEIYVMHPDGTNLKNLTNHAASDWQPRWGK